MDRGGLDAAFGSFVTRWDNAYGLERRGLSFELSWENRWVLN